MDRYALLYSGAKQGAVARKLSFTLTREEFRAIVAQADGRCMVTGLPFDMAGPCGDRRRHPFSPSIDRINSREGYVKGNCRLVCLIVNLAMSEWGIAPLLTVALALASREAPPPPVRPRNYQTAKEYLVTSGVGYTPERARQVTMHARRHCQARGVTWVSIEYPINQRRDGSWGTDRRNVYPPDILALAVQEVLA